MTKNLVKDDVIRINDGRLEGAEGRRFLRKYHPEYDNVPDSLVPWPYRLGDAPDPEFCPTCGREVVCFYWGTEGRDGYLDVACAGRWQTLLRRWPSTMVHLLPLHVRIPVGRARKHGTMNFDPVSGEPMDGPALRRR